MASSVIAAAEYDAQTQTLIVTFTTGRIYAYEDVPPHVFEAYRFASSKGRYFNEYIRDRFRPTELTEKPKRPSAQIIQFPKK